MPLLNFFIDVDYTLISANGALRPHAETLFSRVTQAGHAMYVWSGVGIRKYEMTRHKIDPWVKDYFEKPTSDYRAAVERAALPVQPDLVVDDHEEIVHEFGGVVVRPYFFADDTDRELVNVADALLDFASSGDSSFSRFVNPRTGAS
ncbi:MAG: hypothetical protein VB824_03465 [Dehalococcoidia bacterium]